MKYIFCILTILTTYSLGAQRDNQPINFDPDEMLQKDDNTPKVLLVGSFHFAYYGLDAHVTKEEDKVNVLSPDRQIEMEELADYISRFKPNKIAVEGGRNSGYIIRRYEEYQGDPTSLRANEIDQIAFRLMKRFDLDTLYGTNSWSLADQVYNEHKDSLVFRSFIDSLYSYDKEDEMADRYMKYYEYDDKLALEYTLLEYFKYMNNEKVIDRNYGAYLVGSFKDGTYEGADIMAMNWYNRNLRIFRNIQNITEPGDRIMVLFGAGHLTILNNLFKCSPEYEFVPFAALEDMK